MPPSTQSLRGRTHTYSWADESDSWPTLSDDEQRSLLRRDLGPAPVVPSPRKLFFVTLVVALVVALGCVAFAAGVLLRPDHRGEVEGR